MNKHIQIEIVDYTNQKAYTGYVGVTVIADNGMIVNCIKTESEGYVIEQEVYCGQKFVIANIMSEEDVKQTIATILPEGSDTSFLDKLKFDNHYRYDISNKEKYVDFSKLISYSEKDVELTLQYYEAILKDSD